ncbi:MAG: hypothetical protein ACYTF6_12950 [Planctomycetota bacterium]|jgi:hypothetical protein
MKVVAITGERRCELVDKSQPKAAEDFVVVKIHSAPMCTEYKAYGAGYKSDCLAHEPPLLIEHWAERTFRLRLISSSQRPNN